MSKVNNLGALAIFAVALLTASCSEASHRLSQEKDSVNIQKDSQKQLIDERTAALKQQVDDNLKRSEANLDYKKQMLHADKAILDSEKKNLEKNAELAKSNLDEQNKECKKTVDRNAKNLEAQLDSRAKAQRYQ